MPTLEERLVAGLEATDWRETASRGPWRRWGKFGLHGGAMYVLPRDTAGNQLWYSPLCETQPRHPVAGPILTNILAAGDKALADRRLDTEGMLIELMYKEGDSG